MDPQVRRHTEKAVELLRAGKLPHAAAEFEHAVRLAPADVTLRQRLGDVYLRLGLRTHAIGEFQHVAGRFAADGELLKAIAICKVILEINPEHQEALHALADLYALQHAPVQELPPSMSGAVTGEREVHPLDLESLALFRDALEGVALPKAVAEDDEEATVVRTPRVATIDLTRLPPSPLFSSLDKAAFEAVVRKLDLRWATAGETLVREGEQGDSMFVVVQGVVNVVHGDRVIAVMGEGSFFGEMALVTDSPRLATVVAAQDGLLFEIQRARLEDIAREHPAVGKIVAGFYQDRLLANVLRASPIFRPLTDSERHSVGERFVRHSLPPQTVLLEQGKPGAGFCVLLRGKCEVFHHGSKGEQLKLPALKEGDIFGEISLLLGSPCTATVRTLSFCEVLELPRDDFKRLVLPDPRIKSMVEKLMAERLERTADLLERESATLPDYLV
ncbi:MAG: cyclic nucleotide-binding domain-containing protein [Myxococcales bacterium]|nr:cyclic nucleotide-binding domain-containing protein [Myxococcales bacterium]